MCVAGELDDLADVKQHVEQEFCSICIPDAALFASADGDGSSSQSALVWPSSTSRAGESDTMDQVAYLRSALDENRRLKTHEAADTASKTTHETEYTVTTGPIQSVHILQIYVHYKLIFIN